MQRRTHTHTLTVRVMKEKNRFLTRSSFTPRDRFKKTLLRSCTVEEEEEEDRNEEGKEGRKGGRWSVFPSSGREKGRRRRRRGEAVEVDLGEVNCRKLRGSVRGPGSVILWGRNWGSYVCADPKKAGDQ